MSLEENLGFVVDDVVVVVVVDDDVLVVIAVVVSVEIYYDKMTSPV